MDISASTPVVTGASRGLGRHLVDALLERGAAKVYALARDTTNASARTRASSPSRFDLTDVESIAAAARAAADATLLINNASTAAFAGPLDADPAAIRGEIAVNYEGTYGRSARSCRCSRPTAAAHRQRALAAQPRQHAADDRLLGLQGGRALAHPGAAPGARDARHQGPRRLPGRHRHRHARRHRRAQDRRPPRSPRGCSTASPPTRRTSSPTPTPRRCRQIWWSDPKAFERAFSGAAAA